MKIMDSTRYGIQSEIELKQYDCFVTLYFNGDGWDDVESSIDYADLEEAKTVCEGLKVVFPDIKIQILKIESKTVTEYISV